MTRLQYVISQVSKKYDLNISHRDIIDLEERFKSDDPLMLPLKLTENYSIIMIRCYGHWLIFKTKDGFIYNVLDSHMLGRYKSSLELIKRTFVSKHGDNQDHPLWLHCNRHGKIEFNQIKEPIKNPIKNPIKESKKCYKQ